MASTSDNLAFMNGVPELLILHLLARHEMYGYEIVRAIAESTGQVIAVGEGCVYPLLHAMEKKRWLATRRLTRDGRQRIYYRLTDTGRERMQRSSARWAQLSGAIGAVLGNAHDPKPVV
jgi:PadR family transcriptional regulator, regulatory protein PadR